MKYLCLIYTDGRGHASPSAFDGDALAAQCETVRANLARDGVCLAAEALQGVETATTLKVRNGRLSISDGPCTRTPEQLAGFYLLEAEGLHEALHLAATLPGVQFGGVEVRPVRDLEQCGDAWCEGWQHDAVGTAW